jgi:hypothetical protein
MIHATKRLQKTILYEEHKNLEKFYYKISLKKEFNQQSFLKKYLFANTNSGECLNINYNFDSYHKKYIKSIEQKIYTIEELAKEEDLVPIFITFTLPSTYHPFLSINYKNERLYSSINRSFEFKNIENSVCEGYQFLNNIFRIFYKRIKNIAKNIYYVKVFEIHKTFIPHLHILFYIKKDLTEKIRKKYAKIITEFKLNQTDFSLVQFDKKEFKKSRIKTGINRASKYIMKYILKQLKDGSDYYKARILDGWKRVNKIRIITSSNLSLSLSDYRAIYYNLGSIEKEKLLNKAKANDKSIFYFILKNISIITIVKINKQSLVKQFSVDENSSIILFKYITKNRTNGVYQSSLDKLEIYIDKKLVYEKEKYIKIKI